MWTGHGPRSSLVQRPRAAVPHDAAHDPQKTQNPPATRSDQLGTVLYTTCSNIQKTSGIFGRQTCGRISINRQLPTSKGEKKMKDLFKLDTRTIVATGLGAAI